MVLVTRALKQIYPQTLMVQQLTLPSPKAGDVKQFGQESGYNFNATSCSRSTFGVNVDNRLQDNFADGDSVKSFEAIHSVYDSLLKRYKQNLLVTTVIKKQVLLKDYTQELNTATRGEDGTSMVILKTHSSRSWLHRARVWTKVKRRYGHGGFICNI